MQISTLQPPVHIVTSPFTNEPNGSNLYPKTSISLQLSKSEYMLTVCINKSMIARNSQKGLVAVGTKFLTQVFFFPHFDAKETYINFDEHGEIIMSKLRYMKSRVRVEVCVSSPYWCISQSHVHLLLPPVEKGLLFLVLAVTWCCLKLLEVHHKFPGTWLLLWENDLMLTLH